MIFSSGAVIPDTHHMGAVEEKEMFVHSEPTASLFGTNYSFNDD